jgi:hypothetical protein
MRAGRAEAIIAAIVGAVAQAAMTTRVSWISRSSKGMLAAEGPSQRRYRVIELPRALPTKQQTK